jgi:putative protease
MGVSRVVLPRETSLEEIKTIKEHASTEIKIFVHGALCYAYSGQCLFSSMVGGRSGNRGYCAQPCRRYYRLYNAEGDLIKEGYLLNLKDSNTLDILDDIVATGVDALKIEGRMKNKIYIYAVTKAYRKKLDNEKTGCDTEKRIMQLFNRGFTHGYLTGDKQEMINQVCPKNKGLFLGKVISTSAGEIKIRTEKVSVALNDGIAFGETLNTGGTITNIRKLKEGEIAVRLNHKIDTANGDKVYKTFDSGLINKIEEEYRNTDVRIPVDVNLNIYEKTTVGVELIVRGRHYYYQSDIIPETAEKHSTKIEDINRQFSKTGKTEFRINWLDTYIDDYLYISIKEINRLRREALIFLEREMINEMGIIPQQEARILPLPEIEIPVRRMPLLSVKVDTLEKVKALLFTNIDEIVYEGRIDPYEYSEVAYQVQSVHKRVVFAFPKVIDTSDYKQDLEEIKTIIKLNPDGFIVNNFELFEIVKSGDKRFVEAGQGIYGLNSYAVYQLKKLGFNSLSLSPELNKKEMNELTRISSLPMTLHVYGYQEVMTSETCVINCGKKNCSACNFKDIYVLRDEKNMPFLVKIGYKNRTVIYNGTVLHMKKSAQTIENISKWRINFLNEDPSMMKKVITYYDGLRNGQTPVEPSLENSTKGHYNRGVL